jgi:anti-sigma factor RsiW
MGPQNRISATRQTDDFDIQALIDSQLDWEDEKRIWKEIENNAAMQRRYHELVAQKKLLLQWWASEDTGKAKAAPLKEKRETLLV